MRKGFFLGRAVFAGYFIYNGLNHLRNARQMAAYAASKGTPSPEAAVRATGAMLLAGGASVLSGVKPRQGLATLIAFLIPVSLKMHNFWAVTDPARRQHEMVNFTKNMALAGAALMLMEVSEPWRASVPSGWASQSWRWRRHDWQLPAGEAGGWNYPSGFGGQFAFRSRNPDALPA